MDRSIEDRVGICTALRSFAICVQIMSPVGLIFTMYVRSTGSWISKLIRTVMYCLILLESFHMKAIAGKPGKYFS